MKFNYFFCGQMMIRKIQNLTVLEASIKTHLRGNDGTYTTFYTSVLSVLLYLVTALLNIKLSCP